MQLALSLHAVRYWSTKTAFATYQQAGSSCPISDEAVSVLLHCQRRFSEMCSERTPDYPPTKAGAGVSTMYRWKVGISS